MTARPRSDRPAGGGSPRGAGARGLFACFGRTLTRTQLGDRLDHHHLGDDLDHDRAVGGFRPDIVGAHPRSTSPFGLADTSGNVWEIVRSTSGFAARGGCWYMTATVAHLANRQDLPPGYRDNQIGTRICADLPPQGPVSHR